MAALSRTCSQLYCVGTYIYDYTLDLYYSSSTLITHFFSLPTLHYTIFSSYKNQYSSLPLPNWGFIILFSPKVPILKRKKNKKTIYTLSSVSAMTTFSSLFLDAPASFIFISAGFTRLAVSVLRDGQPRDMMTHPPPRYRLPGDDSDDLG